MVKKGCIVILGLMIVSVAFGIDEYRMFKDRTGQGVEAKIVRYDMAKELVYLEKKDDRKRVNMSIDLFSDADQNYFKEWALIESFMSNSSLKISTKKKRVSKKVVFDSPYKKITEDAIRFEIKMGKKRSVEFPGLKMKYYVVWEEEVYDTSKKYKMRQKKDTLMKLRASSETLKVDQTKTENEWITDRAKLSFLKRGVNPKMNPSGVEGNLRSEMKGIWIRMSMETPSGRIVIRDYCSPENLKEEFTWEKINKASQQG